MDPITQSLLGAAAAQAALGDRLGRLALVAGAVGGELADIDVFVPFADPALPHEYHRHFTHSVLFIPIAGALAALPFLAVPRLRSRWRLILAATTIAAATHPLLDTCTTYGTYLLWPFVNMRLGWDVISIIDPVFTLALLVGVAWSAITRSMMPARVALAAAIGYLGLGVVQHHRAKGVQAALAAARGQEIVRGRVMPTLANLLVWRSVYESGDRLYADAIRVGPSPMVRAGRSLPRTAPEDLPVRSPRVREIFDGLEAFADGYVAAGPGAPGVYGDMRYSMDTAGFEPIWGIRVEPAGTEPEVVWVHLAGERPDAVRRLFKSIVSGEGWEPPPDAR